jgi:hypothetical protein
MLTGDLFLLANGLIAWHTIPDHWWIAAMVLPLTTWLMVGWYLEAVEMWRAWRDGD